MLQTFSLAQIGSYAVVISQILALFGQNIAPEALVVTFTTSMQIVSILGGLVAFFGRWRLGDLTLGGWRKR